MTKLILRVKDEKAGNFIEVSKTKEGDYEMSVFDGEEHIIKIRRNNIDRYYKNWSNNKSLKIEVLNKKLFNDILKKILVDDL